MTLGPKEEHVMTVKTNEQDEPSDVERFRNELALEIERFVAESLEAWATCENTLCRRARRCAGQDCECLAKWSEALPPLSPEQERAHLIDFQKALAVRIGLGEENVTAEQLAEAIDKEKVAGRAAMPVQESDMPAPVVEGRKPAPEKQERIDRARNGCVTEQNSAREPGPRIMQL
jgi:hypothetical protein